MAWFEKQGSTTHFDVVDAYGNALGCTHSLGSGFGSGVTVPGTGAHTCSGLHSCIVLYCIVVYCRLPPFVCCLCLRTERQLIASAMHSLPVLGMRMRLCSFVYTNSI